jgi:hypothetical protein
LPVPNNFIDGGNTHRQLKHYREDANHKMGRNDPCFCGSGKKYKHAHGKEAWLDNRKEIIVKPSQKCILVCDDVLPKNNQHETSNFEYLFIG